MKHLNYKQIIKNENYFMVIDWTLPLELRFYDKDDPETNGFEVWVDCHNVKLINNILHFNIDVDFLVTPIIQYNLDLAEYSEYFRNKI